MDIRERKSFGCFLGSVIGDALGMNLEGTVYDKEKRNLVEDFSSYDIFDTLRNKNVIYYYSYYYQYFLSKNYFS